MSVSKFHYTAQGDIYKLVFWYQMSIRYRQILPDRVIKLPPTAFIITLLYFAIRDVRREQELRQKTVKN